MEFCTPLPMGWQPFSPFMDDMTLRISCWGSNCCSQKTADRNERKMHDGKLEARFAFKSRKKGDYPLI
jgi:hypothetical protein